MRPTDPRLVRRLAPARRPLAGVLAGGVVTSLLVIGQAWLVAGLVVAVVRGHPVLPWAMAVIGMRDRGVRDPSWRRRRHRRPP